jgi:GntR family transcriptional regulator/MocR family aminotransferase
MKETWANSGVDLRLETGGSRRRGVIESALRDAVRLGRVAAGTRLPSSRMLATELGVARNTVADAYGQLVAEGWLIARQGAGTVVADRSTAAELTPPRPAGPPAPAHALEPVSFDLSPGGPDLSVFPRDGWLAANRRAMARAPYAALGCPDPRGLHELRDALAEHLAGARGVTTTADSIIVCTGIAEALSLIANLLRGNGKPVMAVEAYGAVERLQLFRAARLARHFLPVDASGARVDDLTPDDGAVLLTPAHQFPLGVALAPARRTAVLDWARRTGGLVVEDDYDGEFRYDRRPLGALQGLAPDAVVYVGTASVSLAPGLGLAWLVAPPALLDSIVEIKRTTSGHTGVFEQLTLAELIRSGGYDRHVRRSRLRYRERRDLLVTRLADRVPSATVTGVAAGLHTVVRLGGGLVAADEPAIAAAAARAGVRVSALSSFAARADAAAEAALVVGFGTPSQRDYPVAVETLCDALA